MSILEHLEELRSRLLRSAVAVTACFFVGWYFSSDIYNFIAAPAITELPKGTRLAYTQIADPFLLYTKISLLAGIFLASPYLLWQVWMFISPGLYRKEKRWVIPFVTATTLFFFLGGAFAYYAVVPYACSYFVSLGNEAGFQPIITVRELLSFELQMILATGAVFEMPILIFFLTRIGVVTPAFLWHYFGHSMFVIWLIAAWVTPPDIFSMMLVGIPMTALYIIGIGVSWVFRPRPGAGPSTTAAS
jgi:sec-independent protein translocase protein TatC